MQACCRLTKGNSANFSLNSSKYLNYVRVSVCDLFQSVWSSSCLSKPCFFFFKCWRIFSSVSFWDHWQILWRDDLHYEKESDFGQKPIWSTEALLSGKVTFCVRSAFAGSSSSSESNYFLWNERFNFLWGTEPEVKEKPWYWAPSHSNINLASQQNTLWMFISIILMFLFHSSL